MQGAKAIFLVLALTGTAFGQAQQAEPPSDSLKVSGSVKGDAIYETGGQGAITLFAPSGPAGRDNRLTMTLRQSRINFNATKGKQLWGGKLSGTVEIDFYGGGPENAATPRLYRAFIKSAWPTFHVLIGQDWDTNSELYGKTLIFFLPPVGNPQFRRFQVRAVQSFSVADRAGWSLALALAQPPQPDLDGRGVPDGDDFGWPMLEGRFAFERYKKDKEGHGYGDHKHDLGDDPDLALALSGHLGGLEVDWDGAGAGRKYSTWSLTAEACVPLGDHLSFKCEAFRGKNLLHAFGGISQGPAKNRNDVHAAGGWGQLEVNTALGLQFHLGAGIDHPRKSDLSPGDRSHNVAYYTNVYYKLMEALTVGFEGIHYETDYLGGEKAKNERGQVSFIFVF